MNKNPSLIFLHDLFYVLIFFFFNLQKQIAGTLTTNPKHKAFVSIGKIGEIMGKIRNSNPDYSELIKYFSREKFIYFNIQIQF